MFRTLRYAGLALALAAVAVVPAVPAFAGEGGTYVQSGGLVPTGSNGQGGPQSANSLPSGFYNGTPVMQHHAALQNYWNGQG